MLNINDNKPIFVAPFNPLDVNMNKDVRAGTVITKVQAYDDDIDDVIQYSLKESVNKILFNIDSVSGEITAKENIASRRWPYSLTVIADDRGLPSKQGELDVNVLVIIDTSNLTISTALLRHGVNEGHQSVGMDITRFTLQSRSQESITYSIVGGNFGNKFCVDVSGRLVTVKELDHETKSEYNLKILVNDGNNSEISNIIITVNNIDDSRPYFPANELVTYTDEDSDRMKIWTANATDSDFMGITYGIVGVSRHVDRNSFEIYDNILMIKRKLDRELLNKHVLTIEAKDEGGHKTFCRLTVHVKDKNDNSPRFMSRSYVQRVSVNAPVGFIILNVKATDRDDEVNGEIRFVKDY